MSEDNRKIHWEDYNANYVDSSLDDGDIGFGGDDSDESDDADEQIGRFMSIITPNGFAKMVNTPWGPFSINNKFAPFNFYELKIAHLKGFSTHSIKNFTEILDSVEGVAVWKSLDPYCLIIGKARVYTWTEVIQSVNRALLNKEPEADPVQELSDIIIKENKEANINEYTAAIFPNGNTVQITPDDGDYENKLKSIYELFETLDGVVLIENGVKKCK